MPQKAHGARRTAFHGISPDLSCLSFSKRTTGRTKKSTCYGVTVTLE